MNALLSSIKLYWVKLQEFLDVDGDVVMLFFTAAIIFKILKVGLNPSDAVAYGSAIGLFGYSKVRKG